MPDIFFTANTGTEMNGPASNYVNANGKTAQSEEVEKVALLDAGAQYGKVR